MGEKLLLGSVSVVLRVIVNKWLINGVLHLSWETLLLSKSSSQFSVENNTSAFARNAQYASAFLCQLGQYSILCHNFFVIYEAFARYARKRFSISLGETKFALPLGLLPHIPYHGISCSPEHTFALELVALRYSSRVE